VPAISRISAICGALPRMAVAARMNPAARQDWHPRNELNEAQGEWTELYREDESCTAVPIRPARASERL
jgi:hypothetical protein